MKFTLTIPQQEIESAKQHVIQEAAKKVTVKGFRQGKAPLDKVEAQLDTTKVYEEVINRTFPQAFRKYLDEHKLKPIADPQVSIKKADPGTDWEFEVEIAEKPEVVLNDYQDKIKTLKAKNAIWLPGKDTQDKKSPEDTESEKISEMVKTLLETCQVEVPQLLVDQEVNRRLARMVKQIDSIGLSVDDYLKSQGTTKDQLKTQYAQDATTSLQLDFILEAIAEDLKLAISNEEIDHELSHIKDETQRKTISGDTTQRAIIGYSLLRQKVVQHLLKL